MSWESIPGQGDDIPPFYEWLSKQIPHGGRFIEIGSFFGRSIALMGTLRPDLDIWTVDCWDDNPHQYGDYRARYGGTMWRAFNGGMLAHAPEVYDRLHVVRSRSEQVFLPACDAIFIDGGHDYPSVSNDVIVAKHDLVNGGIISGHDWGHVDVMRAVREELGEPNIGPGAGSWCWWVKR